MKPRSVGVVDVIWFNNPTYAAALAVVVGGIGALSAHVVPAPLDIAVIVGVSITAWWLVASVVASWWVFEGSGATRWTWLSGALGAAPATWINITSGFDDTTERLRAAMPGSAGNAIDIFDGRGRHDGALRRARAAFEPSERSVRPGEPLPVADGSRDAVFILMAAHELEPGHARPTVFSEVARVLRPGGRLVVVEFRFDSLNVAVFGPGAFHFEEPNTWRASADAAGLRLVGERRLAFLATGFVFERP